MQLSKANFTDRLYLIYFLGLTVAIVLLRHRVPGWTEYVALHAIVMALIAGLVVLSPRWRHVHAWYPLALPLLLFHEVALLRTLFLDDWQDRYILDFEARLLATPPTVWLGQLRSPFLSELLQVGYLSYFLFLPVVAGVLYRREDKAPFHSVMAATVLGYLTCYVIFLVLPTEGPAHTLRHLHTQPLPDGALHSVVAFTQRAGTHGNAFPSAHAVGAVVPVIFAWRYVRQLVPWLVPLLVLMSVGAVYDRYHYASDIIAGAVVGIICAVFVMIVQPNQRERHYADVQV